MGLLKKKQSASEVLRIPLGEIRPNREQPRAFFEEGALSSLAESIRRYGVLQPISVRASEGGYEIIAGERRFRAAKMAGLSHMPCIVYAVDGEKSAFLAVMENLLREDLNMFETAVAMDKLCREHGLTQEEVAERLSVSQSYVANKVRACEECGFKSTLIRYEEDITEEQLLAKVDELNNDSDIDGFIVQLPLPKHIDEQKITEAIDYRKDVDGFHPVNAGRLAIGLPCFLSATPNGIMELLRRYNIDTKGKKCVVLGRSNIVGKPMASLMMQKQIPGDATVTVCHSHTQNIAEECRNADIIIAALGQPHFVKADMVKEGAVIIDVGTTRVPDATRKSGFRLCGDVDYDNVAPKCSYITPVPGGVGPMTIVSLMKNTLLAGKREIYK